MSFPVRRTSPAPIQPAPEDGHQPLSRAQAQPVSFSRAGAIGLGPSPAARRPDDRASRARRQPVPGSASREAPAPPEAISRQAEHAAVPEDYALAQGHMLEWLRERVAEAGLTVLRNDGAGQNLCAISAMLQLAGCPSDMADASAIRHMETLAGRNDALGRALRAGQGIYADPQVFRPLAESIFEAGRVPPFVVMTAGPDGRALLFDPMQGPDGAGVDPATVPDDAAVVLDGAGHFEAVRNDSGDSWSSVLARLHASDVAPDVADEALIASYVQASRTARTTAASHAQVLRDFAPWLRAHPAGNGSSLGELRNELMRAGLPARGHSRVMEYRREVGEKSTAGRLIASALDALVNGGTRRVRDEVTSKDAALIAAYVAACAGSKKTAQNHASLLWNLAQWLRKQDSGVDHPLGDLCDELTQSDARAFKNARVVAFRNSLGEKSSTGNHVAAALDALVKARAPEVPEANAAEEALIADYVGRVRGKHTAAIRARELRAMAPWLREHAGEGRPSLAELRDQLRQAGQSARDNPHVIAYLKSVGDSRSAPQIEMALDGLVTGARTRRRYQVHPDDKTLVAAMSYGAPNTSSRYSGALRALAHWLRSAAGRPSLRELLDDLGRTGGHAVNNAHVMAFRQADETTVATGNLIAAAVDVLVRARSKGDRSAAATG